MTDEGYGRFGSYSRVELERFFYLDDEDRRLIAVRRRDYNRLGFALQMVTVRHLGMFLADPLDVPAEVVAYVAEQLPSSNTPGRSSGSTAWWRSPMSRRSCRPGSRTSRG
ncbi:DUF4158 domain-containing protein [Nocardia sp. NPDC051990]|uniref:DUF4158 domain-containing protein n=1 Tax=Nocardia sp. NPDC051990 TaxID=3155285 RepID=UPI003419EA5A